MIHLHNPLAHFSGVGAPAVQAGRAATRPGPAPPATTVGRSRAPAGGAQIPTAQIAAMSLSTTPSPAAPRPIQPSESSTVPSAGTAPKSQGTAPGTQQPGRPAGPGSVQLSGARVSEPVSDQQKSEQSKPTTASGNKFLNATHPFILRINN